MLNLEFDFIMLLIIISIGITGYITGLIHEIFKIVKLVLPFFFTFLIGDDLSRFVFNSTIYHFLISKVPFLTGIKYFNTVIHVLFLIFIFSFLYAFITIIVNFIQKSVQLDVFTFKLGKFDPFLGMIISVIRSYLLLSILILPIFIFGFTSRKTDFFTRILMDHPPQFSEIGQAINEYEPVLKSVKAVKYMTELFDLKHLEKEKDFVLEGYLSMKIERAKLFELYHTSGASYYLTFKTETEVLEGFLTKPELFIVAVEGEYQEKFMDLSQALAPKRGIYLWANTLELSIEEEIIESFHQNYEQIVNETKDETVKEKLQYSVQYASLYYIVDTWYSELDIHYDEFSDEQLQFVVNRLIEEFKNDKSFIVNEILLLKQEHLTEKLHIIEEYIHLYETKYSELSYPSLDFKHQLIKASLKDIKFSHSPVINLALIDWIENEVKKGNQIFTSETIYETLVKIITSNDEEITEVKMNEILESIQQGTDKLVVTEEFVLRLIEALFTCDNGTYIQNLIDNDKLSLGALMILRDSEFLQNNEFDLKEEKELKANILLKINSIIEGGV